MSTPPSSDVLVLHAAPRVVVRAAGASPSIVATAGGVDAGGVACGRFEFGAGRESDAGALLRVAGAYPGVRPGQAIPGSRVADGSLRLASLGTLAAAKGGTGKTAFAAGAVVGARGGPGGEVLGLPGLAWDGATRELAAAGASVGGLPVIR